MTLKLSVPQFQDESLFKEKYFNECNGIQVASCVISVSWSRIGVYFETHIQETTDCHDFELHDSRINSVVINTKRVEKLFENYELMQNSEKPKQTAYFSD